jgi:hypothetical protein
MTSVHLFEKWGVRDFLISKGWNGGDAVFTTEPHLCKRHGMVGSCVKKVKIHSILNYEECGVDFNFKIEATQTYPGGIQSIENFTRYIQGYAAVDFLTSIDSHEFPFEWSISDEQWVIYDAQAQAMRAPANP